MLEDLLTPPHVVLRIGDGIVARGILRDAGDDRGLGEGQIADGFAEIAQRSGLYAEGIVPEVDGVQVIQQNIILAHGLLELHGKILFLDFTADGFHARLAGPPGENIVLDQLLGDRGSTLGEVSAGDGVPGRAEDTLNIDAAVRVETLVLDGDKRVLHILRDHVHGDRDPVRIRGDQLGNLVSVRVIDKS